ncbi:MAG: hypothetical protein ACOYK8_07535 [Alphaproteobacteria bacterium]
MRKIPSSLLVSVFARGAVGLGLSAAFNYVTVIRMPEKQQDLALDCASKLTIPNQICTLDEAAAYLTIKNHRQQAEDHIFGASILALLALAASKDQLVIEFRDKKPWRRSHQYRDFE